MKALVLEEYGQLVYKDVPEPVISKNDDIKIKVKAVSVCGSDIHGFDGSTGRRKPPVIMGHEVSGIVSETGSSVSLFKPGDKIIINSTLFCGKCPYCLSGRINLCDNRKVFGVSCDDYRIDGAYTEYLVVPERIVYRIPDDMPFEKAALVEPLSVGLHAAKISRAGINKKAVVMGAGTIGLFIIQALKIMGTGKIIAVDIDDEKLGLAEKLGADFTVNSGKQDALEKVSEILGEGADVVFDVVGIQKVSEQGLNMLKKGGQLILIGLQDKAISYPVQKMISNELQIQGSYISSDEYPDCIELLHDGKIDVSWLTDNYVPLSEGAQWFRRMKEKEKGLYKIIFNPEK